jgi:predicted O-methyltransferase YrrM
LFRLRRALGYTYPSSVLAFKWAFKHSEISNFYYDITAANRADLANCIALLTSTSPEQIEMYFYEIESSKSFMESVLEFKKRNPSLRNSTFQIGRRVGWYAVARALKPKIIVETGVHHGLGALVLSEAILKNEEEGFSGKYFGTDINPSAGSMLSRVHLSRAEILYGDSIESLKTLENYSIDLFINDSDHSAVYEASEYDLLRVKGSPRCVILGDNSHSSGSLRDFSRAEGRNYFFFKELPLNHFYSGAGIGISLPANFSKF